MDNNFYRDDFEQMLREKADEFKLQPSRRVWRSLYNSMHPSRKWPSVIISLLLITSLVFIGYMNTNDDSKDLAKNNLTDKNKSVIASTKGTHNPTQSSSTIPAANAIVDNNTISNTDNTPNNHSTLFTTGTNITGNRTANHRNNVENDLKGNLPLAATGVPTNIRINNTSNSELSTEELLSTPYLNENNSVNSEGLFTQVSQMDPLAGKNGSKVSPVSALEESKTATVNNKNITAQNDKAWIENFAFYNKSNRKKWKDRMAYEYYVTPGISYRTLKNNLRYSLPLTAAQNANTETYAINQIPSLSAEIGAAMIYSFAKKLRVKTGIQFNYTSYGIKAYETNHPILTTLTLNDLNTGYPYLESRNTSIANVSSVGGTTLHNKTYQVSIPVGLEFKLAGKERLQWYAGATVQPTYIIGGKSYLLSSDNKNYVSDNSMIRKWSFNTGMETFISFKTTHGTTLQIGPQVRFQIPSTYGKKYSMDEKLFSAGLKFGVIRSF